MTPRELRERIETFPVRFTLSDDLIRRLWPTHYPRDERLHWVTWLRHHERRRTNDAARVYNHIQSAPMLIWLADAVLVSEAAIIDAATGASRPGHPKRQCTIFRYHIPWQLILDRFERTPT